MRRYTVIKAIVAASLLFLLFQYFGLKVLTGERSLGEDPFKAPVRGFNARCRVLGIPCFLLEAEILTVFSWDGGNSDLLRTLLLQDTVTFGVFHDEWTQKQKVALLEAMRPYYTVHQSASEVYSDKGTPPQHHVTHYVFQHGSEVVCLVIFFLRHPGFLWHGQADSSTVRHIKQRNGQLEFTDHAGAYDRFDLQTVKLQGDDFSIPSPLDLFLQQIPGAQFLECNYTQAATFHAHHPRDESTDGSKFRRKARQIVARAKQYLDDLGIPFWLSSGTCLGWYRQCDMITYSKDVDFGIRIKDYQEELLPLFEKGGFYLKHIFGKVSDSFELSFQAGDIKIDLFFFYEEPDHMWNGGTDVDDGQKYKYVFPKFSLCWTVFLDLKLRVPCPPLPYIQANYGQDWSVPTPDWDWKASPSNVQPNGFWPQNEWDSVMQIF